MGAVAACCSVEVPRRPSITGNKRLESDAVMGQGALKIHHVKGKKSIDSMYKLDKGANGLLGGKFSSVFRGTQKESMINYAIKAVRRSSLAAGDWEEEVEKFTKLDSPHICRIYECWHCPRYIYFVMELCGGGNLSTLGSFSGLSEGSLAVLVRQMVGAIAHVHLHDLIHGDLKVQDWLFAELPKSKDKWNVLQMQVKLIDFGFASRHDKKKDGGKKNLLKRPQRTQLLQEQKNVCCKAPEQIMFPDSAVKRGADVWALGALTYFMIGGVPPFEHPFTEKSKDKLTQVSYAFEPSKMWSPVTREAKEFIATCFKYHPSDRPRAQELLDSQWMVLAKRYYDQACDRKDAKMEQSSKKACITEVPLPSAELLFKSFQRMNQINSLEKVAMRVAAYQMKPDRVEALRTTFEKMDKNGDGVLSAKELCDGFEALGVSDEELLTVLKEVDMDGSGAIEYSEFIAATFEFQSNMQDHAVSCLFRMMDQDGSGKVTKAEMIKAIGCEGSALREHFVDLDIKKLLNDLDQDGDHELDVEEFKEYLQSSQVRRKRSKA